MQIDIIKAVFYDSLCSFGSIAPALELTADAVLYLSEMVLAVNEEIRYLTDTFA